MFLLKSFCWVEHGNDFLKSGEFKDSYGAVTEDLKLEQYSVSFYPLFLYRRLAYAAILIFMIEYPMAQLAATVSVAFIPVLASNNSSSLFTSYWSSPLKFPSTTGSVYTMSYCW